jgi:hypothetical protein
MGEHSRDAGPLRVTNQIGRRRESQKRLPRENADRLSGDCPDRRPGLPQRFPPMKRIILLLALAFSAPLASAQRVWGTGTPTPEPFVTPQPSAAVTVPSPTANPIVSPTASPVVSPTASPVLSPTASPSVSPTASPEMSPTPRPSIDPRNPPPLPGLSDPSSAPAQPAQPGGSSSGVQTR